MLQPTRPTPAKMIRMNVACGLERTSLERLDLPSSSPKRVAVVALNCARHDPLLSKSNGYPGTAWSFRCSSGWWPGSLRLRASGEHSIHLGPEPMNLECATREHVRLPGHHMPALVCAMREHGGQPSRPVCSFFSIRSRRARCAG